MPGTRLSDTERRLAEWWDSRAPSLYPRLAGIRIHGAPGLRGISDLELPIDYPLTVLTGRNGTGKSTPLALAALVFHSPPGHVPLNALRPAGKDGGTYDTFQDFFFKGPGDPAVEGVSIGWSYAGGDKPMVEITKKSSRWMQYERRPSRPRPTTSGLLDESAGSRETGPPTTFRRRPANQPATPDLAGSA